MLLLSSLGFVGIQELLRVGHRGQVLNGATRGRGRGRLACLLAGLFVSRGEVGGRGHAVEQDLHYG